MAQVLDAKTLETMLNSQLASVKDLLLSMETGLRDAIKTMETRLRKTMDEKVDGHAVRLGDHEARITAIEHDACCT